jgi:hypothetical protein
MGYAHGGLEANAQNGLAIDLPHSTLDFIEVLQGNLQHEVWYNILNTGFRMAPVAGTDYPCTDAYPGRDRFYTQITGPVGYRGWLEGVRKGRTFVTNGPLLDLSVGDQGMGGELMLAKPGTVRVVARVRFDPARDDVRELALIENGRVVHSVTRKEGAAEIRLTIAHPIREAAWLAVRATGNKVGEIRPGRSLAHSAAVYVTLKNAPSLAEHPRAKALAGAWLARLLELKARTNSQGDHVSMANWQDDVAPADLKKSRAELFEVIAAAQKHFAEQAR